MRLVGRPRREGDHVMFETIVRMLLYYPTVIPLDALPPEYARDARQVYIDTRDGTRVHGLYWQAPEARPTVLFFHGNAQTVFEWALIRADLEPLACGLLLIDYPGYGKSTGTPSEQSLYAAGRAAYRWLLSEMGIPPGKIVVFGKSLGGPVAAEVARNENPMGLILESTFSSIPAMIRRLVPLPVRGSVLKSEVYDTVSRLREIRRPVLIIHGTTDTTVPVAEAHTLYQSANDPKELYLVEGAGHNDVASEAGRQYGERVRSWLDGIATRGPAKTGAGDGLF